MSTQVFTPDVDQKVKPDWVEVEAPAKTYCTVGAN